MKALFSFQNFVTSFSVIAVMALNTAVPYAQGVSDQHLASAKKVIDSIHATDRYDDFLPMIARDLKNELTGKDPNLSATISKIVDKQILALIKRRSDLEKEIVRVFAKHFSREELDAIAVFYNSDIGKKFLTKMPDIARDSDGVFDTWSSVLMQELVRNVTKEMSDVFNAARSPAPNRSSKPKTSK